MISKRIKTICSHIEPHKIIADVGCDHGYLIKEAFDKYNIEFAYAIDNKIGPLESARNNLMNYNNVEFLLSDGVADLKEDVEVVVIAGMGGMLIKDIIASNINKTTNVKRFILQANRDEYELRKFMCSNGYYISDENIVCENKKFYEIIIFEKGEKVYSEKEFTFGPILLTKSNKEFIEKWSEVYEKLSKINAFHENEEKQEILNEVKEIICK